MFVEMTYRRDHKGDCKVDASMTVYTTNDYIIT